MINLGKESDERLASHGPSGTMEILLKRAWETNFVEWLGVHSSLLKGISVSDLFSLSISYALAVGKGKAEDIIEAFLTIYPQHKKKIMTAARQLERKGKQEGKQERSIEVARNMIVKLHLDLDIVQKATELTKDELQGILKEVGATSKSK